MMVLWCLLLAGSEPAPKPVAVAKVEEIDVVPTVPVSAMVQSRNDVQITAGIDGRLDEVAEPGTILKKGAVIARVDAIPLSLRLEEQRALAERARLQLTYLDREFGRQSELRKSGNISVAELDQTGRDRSVARSDLRIAEARIRQIEDSLARATIRAQFDGVVAERRRQAGEDVARGVVIARMTDLSSLEVRAFVPVKYSRHVSPGQALRIFGFESQHVGTVRALVPSSDPRSQTFELLLDLPDDALETWAVGQMVSVAVPVRAAAKSLVVPRDALILRQEGTYVYRIKQDDTAERIAIRLGESEGELVAVVGELSAGDRVAVRGAETLAGGEKVRVAN